MVEEEMRGGAKMGWVGDTAMVEGHAGGVFLHQFYNLGGYNRPEV